MSNVSAFPRPAAAPAAPLPPFAEVSDLDAIAAVTNGQREMFEVIVRRYNQSLYRIGMAYLRNHAHVEDAMQNAYVKAFLALRTFERNAAFSTWLTRIMINECLMLLRREKRTHVLDGADPEAAVDAAPAGGIDDQLNRQDMKKLLEQAVAALPRNHRAVYVLREVQELSVEEAARCLGLTPANVKVQLHRARERLKTELLKTAAGVELFTYPAPFCDPMTARVMAAVHQAS